MGVHRCGAEKARHKSLWGEKAADWPGPHGSAAADTATAASPGQAGHVIRNDAME